MEATQRQVSISRPQPKIDGFEDVFEADVAENVDHSASTAAPHAAYLGC